MQFRRIVAFLLFALFLSSSVHKAIIFIEYLAYKDYISKELCENRKKPASGCNGKCYLMKQLAKQEKKEERPNNPLKTEKKFQLFCNQSETLIPYFFTEKNDPPFNTPKHYSSEIAFAHFQPPRS